MAEEFKTDRGKVFKEEYDSDLGFAREKRKRQGDLEPAEWAVAAIAEALDEDGGRESVRIADFGCGDHQFAKALNKEYLNRAEFQNKKFLIEAYDLGPVPAVNTNGNITVQAFPGTNCSDERNFAEKEKYDFVVSSLALWGANDSWKMTLKTALKALKPKKKGRVFLVEYENKFPRPNVDSLKKAGVEFELSDPLTDERELGEKMIAVLMKQGRKFDPDKILDCLSRFDDN